MRRQIKLKQKSFLPKVKTIKVTLRSLSRGSNKCYKYRKFEHFFSKDCPSDQEGESSMTRRKLIKWKTTRSQICGDEDMLTFMRFNGEAYQSMAKTVPSDEEYLQQLNL